MKVGLNSHSRITAFQNDKIMTSDAFIDISKVKKDLHFEPRPIKDGINQLINNGR